MVHFILCIRKLHDISVTTVAVLFITNQHHIVIDFQLSLICGMESQFIQ